MFPRPRYSAPLSASTGLWEANQAGVLAEQMEEKSKQESMSLLGLGPPYKPIPSDNRCHFLSIFFFKVKSLSRVRLFATPQMIQSMEFSRPEYWSG